MEARETVAQQLDGPGFQRPLPVQEAIAELCHRVDFCGQASSDHGIAAVLSRNPEIMSIATEATALGQYTLGCYGQMNPLLFGRNEAKLTRYYNLFRSTLNTLSLAPEFRGTVNRRVRLPTRIPGG